ncbi:MAG: YkgJ family cysteine cluster protein [Spirochaetia bacterium]|jgi:Fe-S-cluster containining protein|nr:YkgJ family cysteine cluster protein [Spirochaetia bacterium]
MVISDILPPSLLRDRLQALAELYRRADEAVTAFCSGSGLACPHGCGTCCEGFVPDVMPLEAAAVAVFLAEKDKAAAWSLAGNNLEASGAPELAGRGQNSVDRVQGCPLYVADSPWHCSVYEARPLVCRLFAFSAVRDKRGQSSFSLCRLMPAAPGAAVPAVASPNSMVRSATGSAIMAIFGAQPPVMTDYGNEVLALDPHSNGDRAPLPEALVDAMSQVLFLAGLKVMDSHDDHRDDDPDLRPPLPRAG